MAQPAPGKVTASHLQRDAYLYIRQSTVRQVFENTESTRRQYALKERAVALGWPIERVVVIDSDLGQSGATSTDREGFKKLVGDVGIGRAGIVLGLEVSRLARNSTDWHRLLEICALTDTLILDEDGLYNPSDFNDRLLLGLKGTMSEAELHVLRARLRGGILNQARRGALKVALPVGLVYDDAGSVMLDQDSQIRSSLNLLFETFHRTASASATVRHFRTNALLFPRRSRRGPQKGEVQWGALTHWRALNVLHNPRYAGAFVFGRNRVRKKPGDTISIQAVPQEEWIALLPNSHPGYISWEQFEKNQKKLSDNAQAYGADRRQSPPREGPALLQGIAICGVCGLRMTVRYHSRHGKQQCPEYVCQRKGIDMSMPKCQTIQGSSIDEAIGKLLVEMVTPLTLEVAFQVQLEIDNHVKDVKNLRQQRVERARYEADLARRRFMAADPDNRLVVDTLEADWNERLRQLHEAQEDLERPCADDVGIDAEKKAQILALTKDFPRLWNDPKTSDRERKRMTRLMIEDVTLAKAGEISMGIRFRGGATRTMTLPLPQTAWQMRQTSPDVVAEIDSLLEDHTSSQIADILNKRELKSGEGKGFTIKIVNRIVRDYGLRKRYDRLRERGMLTLREIAAQLGVSTSTIKTWRQAGLVQGQPYNAKNERLYEDPGDNPPAKMQGTRLEERRADDAILSQRADEVQYAT